MAGKKFNVNKVNLNSDSNWPPHCSVPGCKQPACSFIGAKYTCTWHCCVNDRDAQDAITHNINTYRAAIVARARLINVSSHTERQAVMTTCHNLEWPELRPGRDENQHLYLARLDRALRHIIMS